MKVWICSTQHKFFQAVRDLIRTYCPTVSFRFIEGKPTRMIDDIGWALEPPDVIIIDERMKGWDVEAGQELCQTIMGYTLPLTIIHVDSNLTVKKDTYIHYRETIHENEGFMIIEFEVIDLFRATWDDMLVRAVEEAQKRAQERQERKEEAQNTAASFSKN